MVALAKRIQSLFDRYIRQELPGVSSNTLPVGLPQSRSTPDAVQSDKQTPRYPCPFYGFFCGVAGGILMDQEGNQCALIVDSYSPCQMQSPIQTPDWTKCLFNDEQGKELIELFKRHYRVGAKEFWPKNVSSWQGLSFAQWYEYVMASTTHRP